MTLMSPQDLAWLEQDTPYLTRQHQSSPVFLWPTILSEQPCNPVSSTLTTHQHHLAEIWACPRLLAPSLACACTFTESVAVTPQEGRAGRSYRAQTFSGSRDSSQDSGVSQMTELMTKALAPGSGK